MSSEHTVSCPPSPAIARENRDARDGTTWDHARPLLEGPLPGA